MRFLTCGVACRVLVGYLSGGMLDLSLLRMFDLPRECGRHPILGDIDQRLGHAVVATQLANAPDAAADLLDQSHAVEHAEHEWIPRDALRAQVLFAHPGRQTPWRHDL